MGCVAGCRIDIHLTKLPTHQFKQISIWFPVLTYLRLYNRIVRCGGQLKIYPLVNVNPSTARAGRSFAQAASIEREVHMERTQECILINNMTFYHNLFLPSPFPGVRWAGYRSCDHGDWPSGITWSWVPIVDDSSVRVLGAPSECAPSTELSPTTVPPHIYAYSRRQGYLKSYIFLIYVYFFIFTELLECSKSLLSPAVTVTTQLCLRRSPSYQILHIWKNVSSGEDLA